MSTNNKTTNKAMLQELLSTMGTVNQRLDRIEANQQNFDERLKNLETQKPTKPQVQKKSKPTPPKKELEYKAINYATDKIKVYTTAGSSGKENSSIRIWFAEKPSASVLNKLKASTFRYYNPSKEWYAHNIESAVALAREIAKSYK